MARSIRISEKAARVLDEHREKYGASTTSPLGQALEEVRRAVLRLGRTPPSGLRQAGRKAPPKPRKVEFNDAMAELRASRGGVFARPTKAEKRERRAAIREKVFARAEVDGVPRCEGPLGLMELAHLRCTNEARQLAHAFGRGQGRRPESERNCMALCDTCARWETHNTPSAAFWWNYRAEFFASLGYTEEAQAARARAAFVETRSALPAAPRVGP